MYRTILSSDLANSVKFRLKRQRSTNNCMSSFGLREKIRSCLIFFTCIYVVKGGLTLKSFYFILAPSAKSVCWTWNFKFTAHFWKNKFINLLKTKLQTLSHSFKFANLQIQDSDLEHFWELENISEIKPSLGVLKLQMVKY